jgi:hypothetical protein
MIVLSRQRSGLRSMLHRRLLRVLLLGRNMMRWAMLLRVLAILPLWTSIASTLLTLRDRSLRAYVWRRVLLAIRSVVASGRTLVLWRALRVLWIVAAIWLMRIVGSVVVGAALIATASASKSTTTSLRLLVLRLLLRISVLRMLLLLVWRIARRRRRGRRVVVLLGASHWSDAALRLWFRGKVGRRLQVWVARAKLLVQIVTC